MCFKQITVKYLDSVHCKLIVHKYNAQYNVEKAYLFL